MIKKIYRLTLSTFIGPFVASFFITLFVLLMQFLWKYIDWLAGKGLDASVIIELLAYASTSLVPMAIPISVLLSSIMTFGNLAENNELLAFKSAGVSLLRIIRPLSFIVLGISFMAFIIANNVVPKANLKFKSLLYSIKEQKPAMDIPEGIFYSGIEGFSIRIGDKDPDTDMLYDVMIYDKTEERGNVQVTRADSGKMYLTEDSRYMIFDLNNGVRYHEMPEERGKRYKTFPHNELTFEKYEIRFDLSSFDFQRVKEDLYKNSSQMMNINQLSYYIDTTYIKVERKVEYLKRYSKPYFSFIADSSFEISDSVLNNYIAPDNYMAETEGIAARGLIQRALSHARSMKGVLKSAYNEVKYQNTRRIRAKVELHRKFTLSLASFILFFIGAPLGAIIRKGGLGMPVVISVFIFVLFYIVMISAEKAAKQDVIYTEVGMWYPVIFLMPIAVTLTWMANNDIKIGSFAGRIKSLFTKQKKKQEKQI